MREPFGSVDAGIPHRGSAGANEVGMLGCLACHRIGTAGNDGPGPVLTHVGARLDAHAIKHVILDPQAPMPSFERLPHARLRVLVAYLAALR
jgi:mono/diheme cytochrome c family protein